MKVTIYTDGAASGNRDPVGTELYWKAALDTKKN